MHEKATARHIHITFGIQSLLETQEATKRKTEEYIGSIVKLNTALARPSHGITLRDVSGASVGNNMPI